MGSIKLTARFLGLYEVILGASFQDDSAFGALAKIIDLIAKADAVDLLSETDVVEVISGSQSWRFSDRCGSKVERGRGRCTDHRK